MVLLIWLILGAIPEITIAAPLNEEELRNLMYTAQLPGSGTFSIRYPRGRGFLTEWKTEFTKLEIGKGQKLRDGKDVAIITIGVVGNFAMEAATQLEKEGVEAAIYDMRFLKPIDEDILHEIFKSHSKVITVEDGTITGGLGSAVIEFMTEHNYNATVKRLGIPDKFIEQGSPEELYRICGFDVEGITKVINEVL